jgi:predicted phosphodiesterase
MRIAVLSDIHGNRWALERVLEDLKQRGIDLMVNLGDSLYGPLDPAGTAEILLRLDIPTVSGNEDRVLIEPSEDGAINPAVEFVKQRLESHQFEWLRSLPMTRVVDSNYLLCHGTPTCDTEYLLWKITASEKLERPSSEVETHLDHEGPGVILCGHDHTPGERRISEKRIVIDPGSVGLQAYTDDEPHPHAMSAGSPHARYCIVDDGPPISVERIQVDYDWSSAATSAYENGRPDWSEWLRLGRA